MLDALTDGGWAAGQWQMLRPMLVGTVVSLEVFALTLALSIPLSIPIAFGRMSKWTPLRRLVKEYLLVMHVDEDYFDCDDWVEKVASDLQPLKPLHDFLNYVFE